MIILIAVSGCDDAQVSRRPTTPVTLSSREKEQILEAVARAERDSQNAPTPEPAITLSTPPGWTKSEPRPLPAADHGFTVAYEHTSGLGVTFYQFTRGLKSIPGDANSTLVKEELQRARVGIEQAVELGFWQAAKESATGSVALGDSEQNALWSQYNLTVDGATVVSDIYVWADANTFFKLRCTSRSDDVASNQAILRPLLTSLGSPGKPAD